MDKLDFLEMAAKSTHFNFNEKLLDFDKDDFLNALLSANSKVVSEFFTVNAGAGNADKCFVVSI